MSRPFGKERRDYFFYFNFIKLILLYSDNLIIFGTNQQEEDYLMAKVWDTFNH